LDDEMGAIILIPGILLGCFLFYVAGIYYEELEEGWDE
jgi:hypothetical protein